MESKENFRTEVIKRLRSFCVSNKGVLSLRQLSRDYSTMIGEQIPYKELGFKKLEDFLQSEKTFRVTKNGNEYFVDAQPSEKSAHVAEMVAKQNSRKRLPRVRFAKSSQPPPRFHQTSKWRPKANFPSSPKNYQGSKRPQAVSHTQFVNRGKTSSATTKVPVHSNSTSSQEVVKKVDLNQRLTSNRLKHNTKAVIPNSVQTVQAGGNLNGSSSNSNPIHKTKKDTASISLHLDIKDDSINPLVATKRRIAINMSELNLESCRDSGNSSPTNDILPLSPSKITRFVRTEDPLADLMSFAELHNLGEVVVNIAQVNTKRNKFYTCKIKIGQKYTYTSYPEEFSVGLEAQNYCCNAALSDLIPKTKRKSLMISSENDILERIPPMLEKHNHGIWAWQLKLDYSDRFNELLSDDWLKIVDSSPHVQIEKISDDYILYHCMPENKGRRSRGPPTINVSVPTNTVQFGEDEKLIGLVTCVMSVNEIWCQQIETDESHIYANMMDRLQVYYQKHEKQLIPQNITTAGYYIAKYDDGYYRVRAVNVNEQEIGCFFIDCGDELTIPKNQIFELKREYASAQAQAFVCRLVGLEELYEVSSDSQCLVPLCDRRVVLEISVENLGDSNNDVLPVFMYDFDNGQSINADLIPKLTMELASPNLQKNTIVEVFISNIETNGDVYVQVRTQGYENLLQLKEQIEKQIKDQPPKEILYKITKNNSVEKLYFFKSKSEDWCRIKLIDWSPQGDFAQIYFVDYGHTDVIKVSNEILYPLETLNDVFNNYPYQAVRLRMALDKIPQNFIDLANKAMPKDQPVLLKIVGTTEDNLPLVELFKRNLDVGLFCINKSISLEAEINVNKEDNNKGKFKLSLISSAGNVPSTGFLRCPPLPIVGEFFEVRIPFAVSPYNFFIQPLNSKSQLDDMMEKLQDRYKNVQYGLLNVNDISPGNIYASKHDDGFWYRTSVIKVIHLGSVSVFYCDFGYYQTLQVKQLVPLDREFMDLPYQALKAKLAGVRPVQSKWTMEDCEEFKKFIEKKQFFALFIDSEKDVLHERDLVLKIMLIDTKSDEDVYIGKELIKKGVAVEDASTH